MITGDLDYDATGMPHFWNRHTDNCYVPVFHSIFTSWQLTILETQGIAAHLDQLAPASHLWLEWYGKLLHLFVPSPGKVSM